MDRCDDKKASHEVDQWAEFIIDSEIYCRDTSLIGELAEAGWDEFWVHALHNAHDESVDVIENFLIFDLELDLNSWKDLPFDEQRQLARDGGFQPELHDVLEYWRVSGWLADALIADEQPVFKNRFGCWWGRTCTGQSILMDGTIQRIARKFLNR